MPTHHPAPQARLLDIHEVTARRGCQRVKHYTDIKAGLMTPPVTEGPRFSRWPEHEIDAVVRARISGASDEDVRALVTVLMAQRLVMAPSQLSRSEGAA